MMVWGCVTTIKINGPFLRDGQRRNHGYNHWRPLYCLGSKRLDTTVIKIKCRLNMVVAINIYRLYHTPGNYDDFIASFTKSPDFQIRSPNFTAPDYFCCCGNSKERISVDKPISKEVNGLY